ncbi:MAG: SMP-30/gluconolactonase/LRE family protein [Muribaculaceae bacterium]|nr:SMP-30/gluconolactonase/LRE family protein [Muribaculaceae bacterium]
MKKILPLFVVAASLGLPATGWAYSVESANSPLFHAYGQTDQGSGIYSFNTGSGSDGKLIEVTTTMGTPTCAAYRDGKYYVAEVSYNWLTGQSATLVTYDAETWEEESRRSLELVPSKGFDISPDGKYLLFINNNAAAVYAFDLETLEKSTWAEFPGYHYINDMCVEPDGNILYFSDGYIFRVVKGESDSTDLCQTPGGYFVANSSFCDPNTGIVYYATRDENNQTYLNSLDPTTYDHKSLGMIPDSMVPNGLYLPKYADNVPEALSEISFDYASPGSTEATIKFTVPSSTIGGTPLSGDISIVLVIDGEEETLSKAAGTKVSVEKTLTKGNHTFSLFAKNAEGISPERRFTSYCGSDLPREVENLTFEISDTGVATLSWTAPTQGQNGGMFDSSALKYDVYREPNSVLVAEGITATSFSEQLSEAYAQYYYRVIPRIGDEAGLEAKTEKIKWGDVNVPPFVEDFDDWYAFSERFTTYNPLEDGMGWNNGGSNAQCFMKDNFDADYWMFTPAIKLQAGEYYTFSFDSSINSWGYGTGELETFLCSEPDSEATVKMLTSEIVPYGNRSYYATFSVETDGKYWIAFHNITKGQKVTVSVDNISVKPNADKDALTSPSDVVALAAPLGELSTTISFSLPTATSKITVKNLTTGETVAEDATSTVTDAAPGNGYNTYEVYAVDGGKKSVSAFATAFVGTDKPLAPANFKAIQTEPGKARLTWDPAVATGVNGGYVNPENVVYKVVRYEEIDGYYAPQIASEFTGTTLSDEGFELPENGQAMVKYVITPSMDMNDGPTSSSILLLGSPAKMPYTESMAGGKFSIEPWKNVAIKGGAEWNLNNGEATAIQPYDADGGFLMFTNSSVIASTADFRGPRISMKDAHDPELSLYVFHGDAADEGDLTLTLFATPDDGEPVELGTIDYNDGTNGWKRHAFDLSNFVSADNIYLDLRGYALDGSAPLFVDNLRIASTFDVDAELSGLNIPASIEPVSTEATVDVANLGKTPATFEVVLYKNDEKVSEAEVKDLAPGESKTLSMDMATGIADAGSKLTYRAEIIMDSDENPSNNVSADVETQVKVNLMPTVEIEGEVVDNTVALTWEKPAGEMIVPLTDDFEDYSAYALSNFGDWITVDVDGKNTIFSKFNNTITNAKAPMAFEVWDNEQVEKDGYYDFGVNKDAYVARSGNKMLITWSAMEESWFGEVESENDNWLISPVAIGGTDMEFYAKAASEYSPETIEILYTEEEDIDAENFDADKFVKIADYTLLNNSWRSIRLVLPLEAKRFAIRHTTKSGSSHLMIDDITFVPAEGSLKEVTNEGYNVYRDGELVAKVNEESYSELLKKKGVYVYHVTALCPEGESMFSNKFYAEIESDFSGVLSMDEDGISMKSGNGFIEISIANPTQVSIASLNGHLLYNSQVTGTSRIMLDKGIYVVTLNGRSVKINVK